MSVAVPLTVTQIQGGKCILIPDRDVHDAVQMNEPRICRHNGDPLAGIDQTDDGCELQDLARDARPEAGPRAEPKNLPIKADARLPRIHEERLVLEVADPDWPLLGERMMAGHRRYQRAPGPFF